MKIHEYQAKELFKSYDIPIPQGGVAFNAAEAEEKVTEIGSLPVVIKAQIHAGGRGKGGGVKIADSEDAVRRIVEEMIGMNLVTHQTGPDGREVRKVLIEQALEIERELYLSIVADRSTACIVILASRAGGMDIEEIAQKTPEMIVRVSVDPLLGFQAFHARQLTSGLGLSDGVAKQFAAMIRSLVRLFVDFDCSLVEINPLTVTRGEQLIALDAKISFDENALFRHPEIMKYRDPDEEDPLELEASKYGLNYIRLDGNVGNMVNGAGLAMATMDIIKQAGAKPANFLDVGGGANADMVENGFRIIQSDKNVKAILINIFGGISRCDVLSTGVVQAARKTGIHVPVVVRMEGTNADEGRKILAESGFNLISASDLEDAAQKIAEIAG